MKTKDEVLNSLDQFALEHLRDAINLLLLPAIRVHLTPVCDPAHYIGTVMTMLTVNGTQVWPPLPLEPLVHKLPNAVSKFGGDPDVGPEFIWPDDSDNEPLHFFAQINFGDVVDADVSKQLPSAGLLLLFLSSDLREHRAIYYRDGLSDLVRKAPPPDSEDMFRPVPPYSLSFSPEWTLPSTLTFEAKALNLSEAEQQQFYALQTYLGEITEQGDAYGEETEAHHTLLGWSDEFDSDGRLEWSEVSGNDSDESLLAEVATGEEEIKQSRLAERSCLFLQVKTSSVYSGIWDYGWEPFFYIRKQDLTSGNLENVWVVSSKS